MGVMSCSRPGCDSIMCDTHIPGIGYICYECQKEFKDSCGNDIHLIYPCYNEEQGIMFVLSEIFMKTEKGKFVTKNCTINQFFEKHTKVELL